MRTPNILQMYYDFLNSLTLIQEVALMHIFLLITIFFSILSILAVLSGNEPIKDFNLEKKYKDTQNNT